jgi:hypothetical protein
MAGATVVGVDVSAASLKLAAQRAAANNVSDRVSFAQVPAEDLASAFPAATFDGATGYAAVHHVDLGDLVVNLDIVLKPGAAAIFPYEPVAFSALLDRVRKSGLVRRAWPVGSDTDDEQIIQATALVNETFPFRIEVEPFHLTTQAFNLIPINARTARFLERFLTLSTEADNGIEELFLRLARLDHAILAKLPGARRLCRQATLTMTRP